MDLAGKFIVIDGPDGAGKGTQLTRLVAWLREQNLTVTEVRDPGGTEIGERIRGILLDHDLAAMDPACEALLFMASRAQLVAEKIFPALQRGELVLGDRFISATCAYQAAAGYPLERVIELGYLAVGDVWPDLTIVLDVPSCVGTERRTNRERHATVPAQQRPDAMERRSADFHERVCENFRALADVYPRPLRLVSAEGTVDAVFERILAELRRAFS